MTVIIINRKDYDGDERIRRAFEEEEKNRLLLWEAEEAAVPSGVDVWEAEQRGDEAPPETVAESHKTRLAEEAARRRHMASIWRLFRKLRSSRRSGR